MGGLTWSTKLSISSRLSALLSQLQYFSLNFTGTTTALQKTDMKTFVNVTHIHTHIDCDGKNSTHHRLCQSNARFFQIIYECIRGRQHWQDKWLCGFLWFYMVALFKELTTIYIWLNRKIFSMKISRTHLVEESTCFCQNQQFIFL